MKDTLKVRVRFGAFELDLKAGELWEGGRKVVLPDQPFQVLRMLVESGGAVVSREEIQKQLWPNDTVVEFDHSISAAINKLRRFLGDSADDPKYIETLARRGYRLMPPVEWVDSRPSDPPRNYDNDEAVLEPPQLETANLSGMTVSHYRVLEIIGGGGMGVVYRAEDLKLPRAVALKVLPEDVGHDPRMLERFELEARAASVLEHPNICSIYEFGEHAGRPFIVMQLLRGQTLRDRMAERTAAKPQQPPFAVDELLDIAIQIAHGLEAAHEKGIIHRDIKPANIFLTERGVVKILDFGLVKLLQPSGENMLALEAAAQIGPEAPPAKPHGLHPTHLGDAVGTEGYMSPEQVRGEDVDTRTDLFSFGVVLYEMVTGHHAFSGKTGAVVRVAIAKHEPVPVHKLNATLPPELEPIINKALEKNRELRYQSAAEMRADLEAVRRRKVPAILPPGPEPRRPRRWKVWQLAAATVILLGLIAAGIYWRSLRSRRVSGLTTRDTIVLADFTNSTNEPVFDGALRQALSIQLEQSPFLNVLSDERISETLKFMNRPANERLTPEVAREVCQRTNSKALLAGSISAIGDHYEIGLRALDCENGNTLASSQAEAENRNQVLKALQLAGNELRGKLGESLASVEKFNLPLAQATTSSLEALQAYTQSRRLTDGGTDAVPYLLRAVELDPSFAMAQLRLAITYFNLNEPSLAFQGFRKAYELRDRVSERERLTIESYYYAFATGELEKAIETYTQLAQTYPDDYDAHAGLAVLYAELGQYDKALAESKDRIRLTPWYLPDANLVGVYSNLGRLDEARAAFEQARAHKDNQYLREAGYLLAFLQGDRAAMQQQLAWAVGKPGVEDWLLSAQSDTDAYEGRLARARELSALAVESAKRAGSLETAATWRANEALREAELGNLARARQVAANSLTLGAGQETEIRAALTLARAGDVAQAQKLADKLNREFPLDTRVQRYVLPVIAAAIELQKRSPGKAIDTLKATIPYELGGPTAGIVALGNLYPAYLRGEAYLNAGQGKPAAAEFQKLIDHPGIVNNIIIGALAQLQLGRAQAMNGDKNAARKSYEDFLILWKDADPDIPILEQAKAEYAKLQ